jgi:hypothetical protein
LKKLIYALLAVAHCSTFFVFATNEKDAADFVKRVFSLAFAAENEQKMISERAILDQKNLLEKVNQTKSNVCAPESLTDVYANPAAWGNFDELNVSVN